MTIASEFEVHVALYLGIWVSLLIKKGNRLRE